MIDRQLTKWADDLCKMVNDSFDRLAKRQDIFNEVFFESLSDEQKDVINQKISDLDNKIEPSLEEVKEIIKKVTKDKQDD